MYHLTLTTKHPKRRIKNREEAQKRKPDLLSECANVFLFSLSSVAGEKKRPYEGALSCSGETAPEEERRTA